MEVCALNFRSVQRLIVRSKEELPLCNCGRLPAEIARTAETDASSLEKPRVALTEVLIAHGCTKAR